MAEAVLLLDRGRVDVGVGVVPAVVRFLVVGAGDAAAPVTPVVGPDRR